MYAKSIALILSVSLIATVALLVSSCAQNTTTGPTTARTSFTATSGDTTTPRKSVCKLADRCTGSDTQCEDDQNYCENYENDDECEDVCQEYFSGDEKRDCLKHKGEVIMEMEEMMKILKRSITVKKLEDIEGEQLCTLLGIEVDPIVNEIKKYKASEAKNFIKWLVDEGYYKNFDEEDLEEVMKHLLNSLNGSGTDEITDQHLLSGFDSSIGSSKKVMAYIVDDGNDDFVKLMHTIVTDEICDESDNLPTAQQAGSLDNCDGQTGTDSKCYGKSSDTESTISNKSARTTVNQAEENHEDAACVLAVYCKVVDSDSDREDVAKALKDEVGDVQDFISTEIDDGGLGLSENASEEWPVSVCRKLKEYWNNGTTDIGLELGS